jgi:glyoxylase-like metal-dependent hydrolase (beta-lactamase superfamily II)
MPATVKLHPLVVAEMKGPPNYWDGGASTIKLLKSLTVPRSKWIVMPIPCFLVEHPERGPIMIDTAFTPGADNLGRVGSKMFSGIENLRPAGEQLRERGIDQADVKTVVMTHLHFDHASGIGQFPNAEFIVERREKAAVKGGLLKGYVPSHLDATSNWREVDVADEHDVLGDGTLKMLFTPGHTDGHCSIEVATEGGPVLLAGDAAYARRSITERWVPLTVAGKISEYKASLDKLDAWIAAHPGAPVICGHDPWSRDDLERSY